MQCNHIGHEVCALPRDAIENCSAERIREKEWQCCDFKLDLQQLSQDMLAMCIITVMISVIFVGYTGEGGARYSNLVSSMLRQEALAPCLL